MKGGGPPGGGESSGKDPVRSETPVIPKIAEKSPPPSPPSPREELNLF